MMTHCVLQVSRLMGMGAEDNVTDQIVGKLEDMLTVVRKVRLCRGLQEPAHGKQVAAGCSVLLQCTGKQ